MPLAELQRRLGLADPTAHLQPRSTGVKAEPELDEQPAEADAGHLAGENGAAGPPPPDGGATDAAALQPGNGTVVADTPPDEPAVASSAIEAAADPAVASDAAATTGALNPEPDAGVAPVHELYEALLRVLLQVPSCGILSSPVSDAEEVPTDALALTGVPACHDRSRLLKLPRGLAGSVVAPPWMLSSYCHSSNAGDIVCPQDAAAAGRAGRMERRWAAILGPGTWPEVLRRYALTRSGTAHPEVCKMRPHPGCTAAVFGTKRQQRAVLGSGHEACSAAQSLCT
jgi:hypothetical protein